MNKWIKESIKLANSFGYLDKLSKIYPVKIEEFRELPNGTDSELKRAFKTKNKFRLLNVLLKLPKFPIDDPYISSLRRYPNLIKINPEIVERIAERLFSLDPYTLLMLAARPKSPTRKLSQSFKRWLYTLNYRFSKRRRIRKI